MPLFTVPTTFTGTLIGVLDKSSAVAIATGVGTVDIPTCTNVLTIALTQNTALTATTPIEDKILLLRVTHVAGAWTLSFGGLALVLNGATGETEHCWIYYDGSSWQQIGEGVVNS